MRAPKTVSTSVMDFDAAKANLREPLIIERDGHPLAVLISIEEYQQLRSLAAGERSRQQEAWRKLEAILEEIHSRPTSHSPDQIEAEITS